MRLSTAVKFIILTVHASSYVPFVLCKKGSMRDAVTDTTTDTTVNGSNNDGRIMLEASSESSSKEAYYSYRRNYVAIIEPDNFVTLFPNGGGIGENIAGIVDSIFSGITSGSNNSPLQGSSTILNGKVYDPADITIVNKPNGVEENDIPIGFLEPASAIRLPFAGGRQPKQPIPSGDSAFFYHGICVATSSINGDLEQLPFRQRKRCRERELQSNEFDSFTDSLTVTSHSCKLNICLGGGGFNCISFYSGTSFVFNVGQQVGADVDRCGKQVVFDSIAEPSLPPPFPSTIIGGTGSFEGIEGTVDIATICGTTGPIILANFEGKSTVQAFSSLKLGLIVQSISINANMPLPVAP